MSQESRTFKRRLLNAQIVKCPRCGFFVRLRRHSGDRTRWQVCGPRIRRVMIPEEHMQADQDWAGLLPI